MTEVSKELMIILPACVTLTLKASSHFAPGKDSFVATIYSSGPQGIIWRSQINHPDARSFSPWREVERIDW